MANLVYVTLSSNAGVLIEFEGTKILLDGIYGEEGHPFSNLGPDRWRDMKEGKPPYDGIDYLLFTHLHPDHFDPGMTLAYMQHQRVKGAFLPDDPALQGNPLIAYMKEQGIPGVLLSGKTDRSRFQIEPHLTVQAFTVPHLDRKFWGVPHFCYLIQCGGKKLLFTADADYTQETFARLGEDQLRAVFVNPLFFSALRHGMFFQGKLHTRSICVYHIPFAPDDTMHMRSAVAADVRHWPADRPETIVLSEPGQRIEI